MLRTVHLDYLPGTFFGPSNLVDLLRHRADHQGQERAFTYLVDGENDEIVWNYADVDRRARAIGAWLLQQGLRGERALLLYPAGLDFIAAFLGCLYAGVVAVPAYPPRRNRLMNRIEAISDDAEAKVALTTQDVWERVQGVLDQTPDLKAIAWLSTDKLDLNLADRWQRPDVHGDTLAFLQYTSGSTGTPKGVMLNHSNLMHNCALIAYAFEHTRSGSGVFWLPSYHDMGLIGGILQPLYVGSPNILMSPMSFLQRPLRWLQAITKYRATTSGGPNFAYDLCVRKITPQERESLDLSCWGLAFNGAEPIHPETLDKFAEYFAPCGFRRNAFYPCYGLAEATLIVSGGYKDAPPVIRTYDAKALENHQVIDALSDENGVRQLVGCGNTIRDQQVVIANPDKLTLCGPDEVGEIWVKGLSVAQGYWKKPADTERVFQAYLKDTGAGPFLRTGDLGFLRDGELFVTGRLKDLMIIRGLNHYPQDIEATVQRAHPLLRPLAGGAFTVERGGSERLVVVNEIERGRNHNLLEVYQAIRRDVSAEHELPVEAIVLIKAGSIPKTSSGKIQRHACKAGFLHDELEVVGQWKAWESDAAAKGKSPDAKPDEVRKTAPSIVATPTRITTAGAAATNGNGNGAHGVNGQSDRAERRPGGATAPRKPTAIPTGVALLETVMDQVRRIAKERAKNLTPDTCILDLGMDSLERMEIVAALEDAFGGRFPENVLQDLLTCRQVADAVTLYMGSSSAAPSTDVHYASYDDIPAANYDFSRFPEYQKLKQTQQMLLATGAKNPYFHVHERVTNDTTMIGGRELINFSSYNYLGMSGDPIVSAAAKEAIDRYGTSVSASRVASGEKPLHRELERGLADFLGVEDAIVYVGGHTTNESTIGHLFGQGDLVLHDSIAHNSIVQGCIMSGARRRPFPHNDWQALDQLLTELRSSYRRVLIAIEGVYSMDGDYPELPKYIEIKKKHKAFLLVDEAHSAGVMGPHGRGIGEHFEIDPSDVDLWMGTLSKTFGSCGGYIAGTKALVEYLKYTCPGFVFSVGMSPANAAAALAALKLLEEEPERVARVVERAALFLKLAQAKGLDTGNSRDSAVVPIIIGNSLISLQLSQALFGRGVNVQPILHPAVEESASRLRFFITSDHTEEQIRFTVQALVEELAKLDPAYFERRRAIIAGRNWHVSPLKS
ncbi:MAG TPA: aminotransferase class I/II-fold pyridoxal phosphate-dependent enzyme [Pirellulales bacterium]|nr:aminotransferase class I/II-fold pyridoxal phosphate-dependent enzyme [Pirellulales bacterium]